MTLRFFHPVLCTYCTFQVQKAQVQTCTQATQTHPSRKCFERVGEVEKISVLSVFQLISGQTIYDGPATIELQSFSVFSAMLWCRPLPDKAWWEGGWGGEGIENWINLSHQGRLAPESFGYSINHLSFTCSLPLLSLLLFFFFKLTFSCLHLNAWLLRDKVKRDTKARVSHSHTRPWVFIIYLDLFVLVDCKLSMSVLKNI